MASDLLAEPPREDLPGGADLPVLEAESATLECGLLEEHWPADRDHPTEYVKRESDRLTFQFPSAESRTIEEIARIEMVRRERGLLLVTVTRADGQRIVISVPADRFVVRRKVVRVGY